MARLETGAMAPDFTLTGVDGKTYSLKDALAQGPILVVFFKVSCPVCQFAFPFLERLYHQAKEHGSNVWGVSQDGKEESARFAARFGVSFPVLMDEKPYLLSRQYGLKFVPSLFLVAQNGSILASGDGFSKSDLIEIQGQFAAHFSFAPQPLFRPDEEVPQYRPG